MNFCILSLIYKNPDKSQYNSFKQLLRTRMYADVALEREKTQKMKTYLQNKFKPALSNISDHFIFYKNCIQACDWIVQII